MTGVISASEAYREFLATVKQTIRDSRLRAQRVINRELIDTYLAIGGQILERQGREGWGRSVVEQLSRDLQKEFPGVQGFSASNLWFMRQLCQEYQNVPDLLQLVREIPWGQNITIMTKLKDVSARAYYLRMTAGQGWSRDTLLNQIKGHAYERQQAASKQHNFWRLCRSTWRSRPMKP